MCRACHLGSPEKASALGNPDKKPKNDPRINCQCTWVVGCNAKTEQMSWIVGHPCARCLNTFHRVLPMSGDSERCLVIDVYGNKYNMHPQVIARAKNLERADS